jgi:putative sigma-54 modulation protein
LRRVLTQLSHRRATSSDVLSIAGSTLRISVRDGRGTVGADLRAHIERRLAFALSSFGERVGQVVVRLSDSGPAEGRGALPEQCQIEVTLRPRDLQVADTGADPFVAVENAAERLSRSVARAVERERGWLEDRPSLPVPRPRK